MECCLNFKNRTVRTQDLKGGGGPKQLPPATNRGSQEPATNRVNKDDSGVVYAGEFAVAAEIIQDVQKMACIVSSETVILFYNTKPELMRYITKR